MEEREQQRLNEEDEKRDEEDEKRDEEDEKRDEEDEKRDEEDEKRGEKTRWRIPIPIQDIIYGKQVDVKRAAKGEKFRETEDKQSRDDVDVKEMDEEDEIQEKLQSLFDEEARKMREQREQPTHPKTKLTEAQKIIRHIISGRYRSSKQKGNGEKWRLEMESKREGDEKVKWRIPKLWLPEITAEAKKSRGRKYYLRQKRRGNEEKRVAERKKWREIEGKQPTALPSQLPTTEVPPGDALKRPARLASMDIKFILNEQ